MDMVDKAIDVIGQSKIHSIMHCTSTYPTDPKDINLLLIKTLQCKYPWANIGFSNHYPGLMALVAAAIMGCELLELHVTLDRTMPGSDQAASIEPTGVFELMKRLNLFELMRGNGEKTICDSEIPIMKKLRRTT
jgi:N-acetylneuraminate synthase